MTPLPRSRRSRAAGAAAAAAGLAVAAVALFLRHAPEPPEPPALPAGLDPEVLRAVREATDQVRADRRDARAWVELGLRYQGNDLPDPARRCYEAAIGLDRTEARSWYSLALVQAELGDPEASLSSLGRTNALSPGFAPGWWRRGFLELDLGRLDAAESSARRALAADPVDGAGRVLLARVRLEQDRPAEAARLLEALVGTMPGEPYVHHLLGLAYLRLGRADEARVEQRVGSSSSKPVFADPWEREAADRRVDLKGRLDRVVRDEDAGRLDEAVALMEGIVRQSPTEPNLCRLARLHGLRGEPRRGLTVLEEALRRYPSSAAVSHYLAWTHQRMGEAEEALPYARRAARLDPANPEIRALESELLHETGWLELALASSDAALLQAPDRAAVRAWHDTLEAEARYWRDAVSRFEPLAKGPPAAVTACVQLAWARAHLGDPEAAREALGRAASLGLAAGPAVDPVRARIEKLERTRAELDGPPAPAGTSSTAGETSPER